MLLSDLLPYCWVRADESDYLLVRHRFYWDYQQYELPEAWLRPLEQKCEQERWLTLDDYIALAGRLSDAQAEFLVQGRHLYRPALLARFEIEPLVSCLPALRFLAALAPAQRQVLSAGRWLPYSRLDAAQRRLFQQAVSDLFPPAQQLFREPQVSFHGGGLANLTTPQWGGYTSAALKEIFGMPLHSDTVSEPAVRLLPDQESLHVFALSPDGAIWFVLGELSHIQGLREHMETQQYAEYIQSFLNSRPGSRLMAARVRRVNILFLVEQGKPKIYQFVLWHPEPFEWSPPKADS